MQLSEILPDRDYGLQMRFERGHIRDFFRARENHATVTGERLHWMNSEPEKYLALLPEGEALLDETIEMATDLETFLDDTSPGKFHGLDPMQRCHLLGGLWEADFLLMKPDDEGVFRMVGGSLCFPSHWGLEEKMGRSMAEIHAPIPGLNETLGRQIDGFLHRIKPGISWERFNWGLSRTPELNLHPSRDIPRLDSTVTLDQVWWRLEEQSLIALPKTEGILFGINIVVKPLAEIKAHPAARRGLTRALKTMSEPMAAYKGIAEARERLLDLMQSE
jgi:hypothetical protein